MRFDECTKEGGSCKRLRDVIRDEKTEVEVLLKKVHDMCSKCCNSLENK